MVPRSQLQCLCIHIKIQGNPLKVRRKTYIEAQSTISPNLPSWFLELFQRRTKRLAQSDDSFVGAEGFDLSVLYLVQQNRFPSASGLTFQFACVHLGLDVQSLTHASGLSTDTLSIAVPLASEIDIKLDYTWLFVHEVYSHPEQYTFQGLPS